MMLRGTWPSAPFMGGEGKGLPKAWEPGRDSGLTAALTQLHCAFWKAVSHMSKLEEASKRMERLEK